MIVAALTRAAADPTGSPLYAGKGEVGLFPPAAAAKPAVKRAFDDGLIAVVRTEVKGKQTREFCAATDKGLQFLLDQASPKQILEDFIRILEERAVQVTDLLGVARRMADELTGLRAAVSAVLPQVRATKVSLPVSPASTVALPDTRGLPHDPLPPRTPEPTFPISPATGAHAMNGAATLDAPAYAPAVIRRATAETEADELAGAILARLSDWAASAGAAQDCPLPELYRSLTCREAPPTIGAFHDSLRRLHDEYRIYLHPWTGPLYALPEPTYALLAGHNIAYYASARS
ncbi:hypothetical protein FRUB_02392 [Fimbriiglobus ruber]|uniref:Uncharacterized protein n=2 Tax=Fimbriiglobus ruber TaxID=1908690 RepID=A0A225DSL0_9BACT|nr:hypothetical protein FRUB_02392 [Fimbriiglobus ruber]